MDDRDYKAQHDPIYLVRLECNDANTVFHVLGTRKIVYKITFSSGNKPKCTCPDFKIRKNVCKHVRFVLMRVLMMTIDQWGENNENDIKEISDTVVSRLPHLAVVASKYYTDAYNELLDGTKKLEKKESSEDDAEHEILVRNEECCVCLCDIDSQKKSDVMLCEVCCNGIHTICWNKWTEINGSNQCVYCRTVIKSSKKKRTGKAEIIENTGWGVLLQ